MSVVSMPPALSRLVPYLLRYRRPILLGTVCLVATTAISLVSPWVLKYAIDDLYVGVTRAKLALYGGLILAIAISGGWFRFQMRRILMSVSREVEYDLRNDFFAHLQGQPLAYFQARRTGDLMSRATNDLAAVRMMVGPAIMYSATTSIVFVVAVTLMIWISPWLTLVAFVPLPIVSAAVKLFGDAIYRRSERIQEQLAELSTIAQEALAGVRVVRAYGREGVELDRFRAANAEYVNRSKPLIHLQGLFFPSLGFFFGVSAVLVLWLGGRQVVGGEMTLGEFVAFNGYLVMLSWPMIAFGWVTNMLQRGMASWKRMLEVLDVVPAIVTPAAPAGPTSPAEIRGGIEFRNLTFAYNGRPVLRDVSFQVEPGQTIALVGATGSGKSTLVSLLPRLFDPPPATVFVDGIDVRHLRLDVLRRAIGFVPQEPFLFSATLADNVAFGAPEAGAPGPGAAAEAAVEQAAAIARLDKDVDDFPKRYRTMVGERGVTLSGGQKQRTALARALRIDPRILVLDDAFSAVDTYTEEEILTGLRQVLRERTSIIVSHRISTVKDADVILVLDDGCVAERGTHAELVGRDGLYANLYRKQLLEEELEQA